MKIPAKTVSLKKLAPVVRLALIIFLPFFIISSSVMAYLFYDDLSSEEIFLSQQEREVVRHNMNAIRNTFHSVVTDLLFLAEDVELTEFLEKGNPALKKNLVLEWGNFSRRKGIYDQIRYISSEGKEIVKIKKGNIGYYIAPENELRDISGRYYFQDSLRLRRKEIYISPFDLTMTDGRIETPWKPVIRFAAPVLDEKGIRRGVLILNYIGSDLIEKIRDTDNLHRGRSMLLNNEGYWLLSKDRGDAWGFMFKDGGSFARSAPSSWKRISTEDHGEFVDNNGLFVFSTIYPLIKGQRSGSGSSGGSGPSEKEVSRMEYRWKVLSHLPPPVLHTLRQRTLIRYLLPYAALIPLLLSGAWITATAWVRQKEIAETDSLTGIYNRRKFYSLLETEMERAERYRRPLSVLLFDIDHFKAINDSFGHHTGDKVLQSIVTAVEEIMRHTDFLARYGGEEFILLCPETDMQGSSALAERLRAGIAEADFGEVGRVTVSLGVADWREREAADDFIRRADDALYEAKKEGRNRIKTAD